MSSRSPFLLLPAAVLLVPVVVAVAALLLGPLLLIAVSLAIAVAIGTLVVRLLRGIGVLGGRVNRWLGGRGPTGAPPLRPRTA